MPLRSLFTIWTNFSLIPRQLRWFFLSITLQRFADALLLVVSPVFLFELAPQLPWINQLFHSPLKMGLFFLVVFYFWERLLVIVLAPFIARLSVTRNLRLALILGRGSAFLGVILYTFITQHWWLIPLIPVCNALALLWYWNSYYALLASEMDVKQVGQEMGTLEVLSKIATVLGPLVGVLVVGELRFNGVFWLAASFHFLAILALMQLPTLRIRTIWRWSDFRAALRNQVARSQLLGLAGVYWESIGIEVFWPVLLFIAWGNMASVGYIFTGATLLSLIFIYLAGWVFDQRLSHNRWAMNSGLTVSLLWLGRILAWHIPWLTIATESLDKLAAGVYNTLVGSLLILRLQANNTIIYAYNRQIVFSLAYLVGGGGLLILLGLNLSPMWYMLSFLAGGLLSLLFVKNPRLRYRLDT